MDVDSNADEEEEQDMLAGEPGGQDAGSSTFKDSSEEKENHNDPPEQREVRTDRNKVSKSNRTLHRDSPSTFFILWRHPS
jgi:hypothetical protein